jgi:PQQ-like domain
VVPRTVRSCGWRVPSRGGWCPRRRGVRPWPNGLPVRHLGAPPPGPSHCRPGGDVGAGLAGGGLLVGGGSPVVAGGRVYPGVTGGNGNGWVYALDAATGATRWTADTGTPYPPRHLALAGGRLVVPTVGDPDGLLLALDQATGRRLWATKLTPGTRSDWWHPAQRRRRSDLPRRHQHQDLFGRRGHRPGRVALDRGHRRWRPVRQGRDQRGQPLDREREGWVPVQPALGRRRPGVHRQRPRACERLRGGRLRWASLWDALAGSGPRRPHVAVDAGGRQDHELHRGAQPPGRARRGHGQAALGRPGRRVQRGPDLADHRPRGDRCRLVRRPPACLPQRRLRRRQLPAPLDGGVPSGPVRRPGPLPTGRLQGRRTPSARSAWWPGSPSPEAGRPRGGGRQARSS